jgi:hypothetical protein
MQIGTGYQLKEERKVLNCDNYRYRIGTEQYPYLYKLKINHKL